MKQQIYLETTITSYLTARPSQNVTLAAHQQITRQWWDTQRWQYDLFISPIVLQEAQAGDSEAAARRISILRGIPLLEITAAATTRAQDFVEQGLLPAKAATDALHIAVTVVNGMHYLLS